MKINAGLGNKRFMIIIERKISKIQKDKLRLIRE